MKLEASSLMPDYYPQFSCKMGSCRSACCEGWPISLSIADYFKLLGADCSEELRKKRCKGKYRGRDEKGKYFSGDMYTCSNSHCQINIERTRTQRKLKLMEENGFLWR